MPSSSFNNTTLEAQASNDSTEGKDYPFWRRTVQTALHTSPTEDRFKQQLSKDLPGEIERHQLFQICDDLLTAGVQTDQGGNTSPEQKFQSLTSKESTVLISFRRSLRDTNKFHNLKGWFETIDQPPLTSDEQNQANKDAHDILWAIVNATENEEKLLQGIETNASRLMQADDLDKVFLRASNNLYTLFNITDAQRAFLAQGSKILQEHGDLPAWVAKEKEVLAQRASKVSSEGLSSQTYPPAYSE